MKYRILLNFLFNLLLKIINGDECCLTVLFIRSSVYLRVGGKCNKISLQLNRLCKKNI